MLEEVAKKHDFFNDTFSKGLAAVSERIAQVFETSQEEDKALEDRIDSILPDIKRALE